MKTSETILVTGATGRVGSAVVDALLADGAHVRAGARDPERIDPPNGVDAVRADLTDQDSLSEALDSVNKVFLYAVPDGIDTFCEAARNAGVEHVVVLSSQTVVDAFPAQQPIVDMHRSVESAVVRSGLPYTFLRPHNFASNILMWGWSESIRSRGELRFPYPESHSDAIHEKDIAACAAAVLNGRGHEHTSYFLSGPTSLTQRRQLEIISEVTGRPLAFTELTDAEARVELEPLIPSWVQDAVFGYWEGSDGVPTDLSDTVEKLTGSPARDFAEWVTDHREAFLP